MPLPSKASIPDKYRNFKKGRDDKIETLKNFLVGIFIVFGILVVIALGIILWPLVLGVGSILIFIAIALVTVIAGFYIIVLIGYMARKGLCGGPDKTKARQ